MVQFGVNLNKATTGHKIQGTTLKRMMVTSWSYTHNWIYVVLPRVRRLEGLFMCNKLSALNSFLVDPKLIQEEERLREKKIS